MKPGLDGQVLLPVETLRDILLFQAWNGSFIVVSCDSSGGIGPKPLDKVKVDGKVLGRFIARVALMEVLASGAEPLCLINTLCVEMDSLGREILEGIRCECRDAGLNSNLALTGSYEKNIPVMQTGVGVVVIGLAERDKLRIGTSMDGDYIVAIGLPKVGYGVIEGEMRNEIADLRDLIRLLGSPFIHEVIPVGSRGIAYEAEVLARSSNLKVSFVSDDIDLERSAGPSTVILASTSKEDVGRVFSLIKKPIHPVARLHK